MNISSLVITTQPGDTEFVIGKLKEENLCEYFGHNEGKIVVTIEGDSVSDEIKIMKALGKVEKVVNVEMIYSYCEDELTQERQNLEIGGKIPDWLNDDNARAEDIRYNGRLKM